MKEKMSVSMHGFFHWSLSDHYSSFNDVGKKQVVQCKGKGERRGRESEQREEGLDGGGEEMIEQDRTGEPHRSVRVVLFCFRAPAAKVDALGCAVQKVGKRVH